MKEVLFLRHAKSSWEYAVADRDRPLQPKGIHAIKAVAKHWKAKFSSYEAIFSSPANRALHTATLLAHEIGYPFSQLYLKEGLYSFSARDIMYQVKQLPPQYDKVIVVGHNPAFSDAADYFCVKPTPELKTADWISITFAASDWKALTQGAAEYGSKKEALRNTWKITVTSIES